MRGKAGTGRLLCCRCRYEPPYSPQAYPEPSFLPHYEDEERLVSPGGGESDWPEPPPPERPAPHPAAPLKLKPEKMVSDSIALGGCSLALCSKKTSDSGLTPAASTARPTRPRCGDGPAMPRALPSVTRVVCTRSCTTPVGRWRCERTRCSRASGSSRHRGGGGGANRAREASRVTAADTAAQLGTAWPGNSS